MRITEVNLPESKHEGLQKINLRRLGKVVLLAGPNGAGKTRILTAIKGGAGQKLQAGEVENYRTKIKMYQDAIDGKSKTPEKVKQYSSEITDLKNEIQRFNKALDTNTFIQISEDHIKPQLVDFIPQNIYLTNCNTYTKAELMEQADNLTSNIGVDSSEQSTLAKIQMVQNADWTTSHQHYQGDQDEIAKHAEDYQRLQDMIKAFLGVELGRNSDGDATLFDRPIGEAKLSAGQSVLLQLCCAIFCQASNLEDVIIFMDEPENHLHPKALIDTVKKIESILPNGQLWIATHSIHLLAHFDNSAIHYVENGNVHYAGNEPEKVLAGLVGGDGEQQKIQDFLHLPAQMALNQYAFECLFPPTSVDAKEGDPQEAQMLNIIEEKYSGGNSPRLRILDYGAGKGRLLQAINQFSQQNGREASDWLDYYVWDIPGDDNSISKCKGLIEEIYGEERRHFTKKANLRSALDVESFDFVVMCNVLHEVPVDTWNTEIGPKSDVVKFLKSDGALLIVEDTLIPIGEKAHKNGFLVLDRGELQKLCKSSPEDDKIKQYVSGKNDRLKAHLVPRDLLANIDANSITSAIEELRNNSRDCIKEIRDQDPSSKNGKLLALWTQLFANASLVLE